MKYLVTGYYSLFYLGIEQKEKKELYETVEAENVSEAMIIVLDSICLTIGGNVSKRWCYSFHEDIKVNKIA